MRRWAVRRWRHLQVRHARVLRGTWRAERRAGRLAGGPAAAWAKLGQRRRSNARPKPVADGDAAHPAVVQGVAVEHSGRVHMDGVVESVARVALAWSGVPQIAHACCPQQARAHKRAPVSGQLRRCQRGGSLPHRLHPFYCRAGVVRVELQGKHWPLRATRCDASTEPKERSASRQRPQALQVAERGGKAHNRGE